MAHQIDMLSKGRASYASTEREWHIGQTQHSIMKADAPIEEWLTAAGMDYEVKRAFVRYGTARDQAFAEMQTMKDRLVLFRSDTGAPLGIVSDGYKVVQPREVLEFFREWAAARGLTIESAGVLFGGKRYFATARITNAVTEALEGVGGKDRVIPYALLSTSADGSLKTEARWTTVRTVCNNTLTLALGSAATYAVSHRSKFKADEARNVIEAASEGFAAFMQTARMLAGVRVSSKQAEDLTTTLFTKARADAEVDSDKARDSYGYKLVMDLFDGGGKGSTLETARGTAWGWLNAVTEFVDHHTRARTEDARIATALWGTGDSMKTRALELVTSA